MDPIEILIADDELLARRRISKLLHTQTGVEIIGEAKNGLETVSMIESRRPELVYLDIQMPDLDGFGVLKQIPQDIMPLIIFVTAFDQYALKAFEFHAMDYLLKPFDDDRFEDALTHAVSQIRRQKLDDFNDKLMALMENFDAGNTAQPPATENHYLQRLAVKSSGRVYFLKTEEIDWIEAAGVYVNLHTGRESHLIRESISKLESQLAPAQFLRIHRSTIVNIDKIKEMQSYFHGEYIVIMKDGTELKLSRSYRDKLQAVLGNI